MFDIDLTGRIKTAALNLGADLVGIAAVERLAGAPEGRFPAIKLLTSSCAGKT